MYQSKKIVIGVALGASMVSGGSIAEEANSQQEKLQPQTGQTEEVVVTGTLSRYSATKSDTPVLEVARSVSIEDEQSIIDKGALTLDDIYTYSAGVTGETYGYATRGDWVKVRGLDVPQYQDSLQSLFGNYNNTRPHIYTLEQVEILKGPASVLYGKGSPGGLVNVVTKRPQEEAQHEVVAKAGTFDFKELAMDSTGTVGANENFLYRVVGVVRDADTQVDFVKDDLLIFNPSLTWQPNENTSVSLLANYSKTESDTAAQFLPVVGTLMPAPNGSEIEHDAYLGEPGFNKFEAETKALTLLAEHQFNAMWSMQFTARYTDAEADYQQAWPAFIGGSRYVFNADGSLYENGAVPRSFYRSDATSEQTATDIRFRADFETGALEHNVLIGAQYQEVTLGDAGYYAYALGYDFLTGGPDQTLGDAFWINVFDPVYGNVPPSDQLDALYSKDPDTKSKDYGVYISDQITLNNLHLSLGVRFDETETKTAGVTQKDDEVSVSVGALYAFESGLSPYISYAESFEPVIGDNGRGDALSPQEGEQTEVGVKYQPKGVPAVVTVAYFDIEQSNLTDPSSIAGEVDQQQGTADIRGYEIEGYATLGDVSVEINLSKLDHKSAEGFHLASVPEEQASTWIGYKPSGTLQGLKTGVGVRYVGESYGGADTLKTPSYTLTDLMLGYELEQWDFMLNVRNLTNKEYYATCLARGDCFAGDERTVVGTVKYRL